MTIVNAFYTYLTNLRASELSVVPMHDIITADYQPVERHAIAEEMFRLAFTADLLHSQRLINVVRMIIMRGVLHKYLHESVDGGLDIQEIEAQYLTRNRPVTDAGVTLSFTGRLRSSYYRLVRINVSKSGDDILVLDNAGQPYNAMTTLGTSQASVMFPVDSCALVVPLDLLPAGINWSSIPENMLESLETNKYVIAGLLQRYLDGVPTTLDKSTVQSLVDSARAESSYYALSVIAILVATHVAKMAGEDRL